MNPTFYRNRYFKDQVKVCFKHTFVPDTNYHINKTLQKKNKSASISYILREWEKNDKETVQSVELCNIYNIIDKYVCIDYLGSKKSKIK